MEFIPTHWPVLLILSSCVFSTWGLSLNICMNHDVTYPSGGQVGDNGQVYYNVSQQGDYFSPSEAGNTRCITQFSLCPYCRVNLTMLDNNFRGCLESNRREIVQGKSKICDSRCTYLYAYDPNYFNGTISYYFSDASWKYVALSKRTLLRFCMSKYDEDIGLVNFKLRYMVDAKAYKYTGSSQDLLPKGTIMSVDFPRGYARDSDAYSYTIESPNQDDFIKLSFDDWNLDTLSSVEFDNANVIGRVDGDAYRPVVTSATNRLSFRFSTGFEYDAMRTYRAMGFKLTYEFTRNRGQTDPSTECGSYNLESTGGVLQFNAPDTYRPVSYDCVWVVKKFQYSKIFLKLIQSTNYRSSNWNTPNTVEIYYGLSSTGKNYHSFPPERLDDAKTGFKSEEGFYIRLRGSFYQGDLFKMAYASYDSLKSGTNECTYGFFTCSNRRCIDRQLRCDGADHCGDNSDEDNTLCSSPGDWNPPSNTPFSLSISIVIPIVVAVFLVVVICLFVVFLRRCQQLQRRHNSRNPQVPSVSGRMARGRRTRRSQIRVTIQQEYEDAPPTYEEAIGTPPNLGYFNMAFMWSQPDIATGLVSPPPYAEVIGGEEEEGPVDNPGSSRPGEATDSMHSSLGRDRHEGQAPGPQTGERRSSTQLNQSAQSGAGLRRNSNTPSSGTNSLEARRSIGQQPLGVSMDMVYADTLERRNKLKKTASPQISVTDDGDKEVRRPAPDPSCQREPTRGAISDENDSALAGRIRNTPSRSAPDLSVPEVTHRPQQAHRRYKEGKTRQRKHRHTSPSPQQQDGLPSGGRFASERPHSIASSSAILPPTPEATLTLGLNMSTSERPNLTSRPTYMSMPEDLHVESPERQRPLPERPNVLVEREHVSPERFRSPSERSRYSGASPEGRPGTVTLTDQSAMNNERQNLYQRQNVQSGAGPSPGFHNQDGQESSRRQAGSDGRVGPGRPGAQVGSSSLNGRSGPGRPGGRADSGSPRGRAGPGRADSSSGSGGRDGRDGGDRLEILEEEEEEYRQRLSQSSRNLHLFLRRSTSDEEDMYV